MTAPTFVTAAQAVAAVRSGDHVFIHGAAATPQRLVQALSARAGELRDVTIRHLHTEGPAPYADPGCEGSFNVSTFFIAANLRRAIQEGRAQYIPVFLSEIPLLFRRGVLPVDVALVHVSPPDRHGFCSLGTSVDAVPAAMERARVVIAQVNPRMPRTHGDGLVHLSRFHACVAVDDPLPEHEVGAPSPVETLIGRHIAGLVEDGATLQMGIGGIPNAALGFLGNHRDLGVHTEMFSDGVLPLIEKGVVNGARKRIHPGKVVSTFAMGSRRLYDFMDDNPLLVMRTVDYVNDTAVICQNPRVTAINAAIEVDLTGQVCADSIGTRMYSGVGGQMDFIRGASLSEGGEPIIALPSQTRHGASRIVPLLRPGAGVVTTRAHVRYIVTEHGAADLYGRNLRERAKALIAIAHPENREALERAAFERFGG